jgi:hypothetical protein
VVRLLGHGAAQLGGQQVGNTSLAVLINRHDRDHRQRTGSYNRFPRIYWRSVYLATLGHKVNVIHVDRRAAYSRGITGDNTDFGCAADD